MRIHFHTLVLNFKTAFHISDIYILSTAAVNTFQEIHLLILGVIMKMTNLYATNCILAVLVRFVAYHFRRVISQHCTNSTYFSLRFLQTFCYCQHKLKTCFSRYAIHLWLSHTNCVYCCFCVPFCSYLCALSIAEIWPTSKFPSEQSCTRKSFVEDLQKTIQCTQPPWS